MIGRSNTVEDFWSKVRKTKGCWLWTRAVDKDGYGFFWWGGKQFRAHRFVMKYITMADTEGRYVLHKCDNPTCVRPDHLFLGDVQENMADRNRKSRQVKGEAVHTSVLLETEVRKIRRLAKGRYSRGYLAKKFKVSISTIDFVVTRRSWKHV